MKPVAIADTVMNLNRLTVPKVDIGQIRDTAHSVEKFYIICSAVELEVFDNLRDPKSAMHLAEDLGLHQGMTQKLCAALVAADFLRMNHEGKYALTNLAKTFLVTSSPLYQGESYKINEEKTRRDGEQVERGHKKRPLWDEDIFRRSRYF